MDAERERPQGSFRPLGVPSLRRFWSRRTFPVDAIGLSTVRTSPSDRSPSVSCPSARSRPESRFRWSLSGPPPPFRVCPVRHSRCPFGFRADPFEPVVSVSVSRPGDSCKATCSRQRSPPRSLLGFRARHRSFASRVWRGVVRPRSPNRDVETVTCPRTPVDPPTFRA